MVIYGVAMLAACVVVGLAVGEVLGWLMGVPANVGGVGIAMLLLILLTDRLRVRGLLPPASEQGIVFWSAVYIPIVVAMAASQDVAGAIGGGLVALLAGGFAVLACFGMVALLSWWSSTASGPSPRMSREEARNG
jgi:malonate transporter MadL subunit